MVRLDLELFRLGGGIRFLLIREMERGYLGKYRILISGILVLLLVLFDVTYFASCITTTWFITLTFFFPPTCS